MLRKRLFSAWVREGDGAVVRRLTKRIEMATGLRADSHRSAEDYQVANYALGGLYKTHSDAVMGEGFEHDASSWELFTGDRIATFMVYVSSESLFTIFDLQSVYRV